MLEKLSIQNLAVVDDVALSFTRGLNILTGSTGAGKSLILGAVNLLLGEKASPSLIRAGEDSASVEGVFRTAGTNTPPATFVLRRDLKRNGRSQAYIDGRPVTAGELRGVCRGLIEPHGQNEQFRLKDPETHIHYVDAFAGNTKERSRYETAYQSWREVTARLREFEREMALLREKQELLSHRVEEIERAGLSPGELDALADRTRLLENAERVVSVMSVVQGAVDGDDGDVPGASAALAHAAKQLAGIADVDTRLAELAENLRQARILADECAADVRRFLDGFEFDPQELATKQERIAYLSELERRYGLTIDEIITAKSDWEEQLAGLSFEDERREELSSALEDAARALGAAAERLSDSRRAAARKLDETMTRELRGLMIKGAEFHTQVTSTPVTDSPVASGGTPVEVTGNGCDDVRFHVRTNIGESPGPIDQIASTGELSRVALALKGVTRTSNPGSVQVFDEVDAGVGADLGALIAQKLLALSEHYQIICITHLPQIAARGHTHLVVRKNAVRGRTAVTVTVVEGDDRRREIARMLGGEEGSDRRTALADELLAQRNEKTKTRVRP